MTLLASLYITGANPTIPGLDAKNPEGSRLAALASFVDTARSDLYKQARRASDLDKDLSRSIESAELQLKEHHKCVTLCESLIPAFYAPLESINTCASALQRASVALDETTRRNSWDTCNAMFDALYNSPLNKVSRAEAIQYMRDNEPYATTRGSLRAVCRRTICHGKDALKRVLKEAAASAAKSGVPPAWEACVTSVNDDECVLYAARVRKGPVKRKNNFLWRRNAKMGWNNAAADIKVILTTLASAPKQRKQEKKNEAAPAHNAVPRAEQRTLYLSWSSTAGREIGRRPLVTEYTSVGHVRPCSHQEQVQGYPSMYNKCGRASGDDCLCMALGSGQANADPITLRFKIHATPDKQRQARRNLQDTILHAKRKLKEAELELAAPAAPAVHR